MGSQHADGNAPVARLESPHRRQQGRRLSRWQALSSARAASARLRKDRPMVKGRQLHAFRRFHRSGQRVRAQEMSARLRRTPGRVCALTTAALINIAPIAHAAEGASYCAVLRLVAAFELAKDKLSSGIGAARESYFWDSKVTLPGRGA